MENVCIIKRNKNVEYEKTNIICLNEIKMTDNFENFLAIFFVLCFRVVHDEKTLRRPSPPVV